MNLNIMLYGGRGASSGISNKGHKYGTDYKTILKSGNIKFVTKSRTDAESLLETMTKGRVYVLLNNKGNPGYIYYYDNDLKKSKEIDLTNSHKKMGVHTHHGYYHNENDVSKKGATKLTPKEEKMVERVNELWYNHTTKK